MFTFDDHIFYTVGKHQIEAGGWLQRLQSNDNLAQNQYGQASFTTLQSFLTGVVATFTVVPAPTELGWRSWMGAGYLEETARLTPRLELRAGIRFESTNGFNESQGRASVYTFNNGVISTNPTVQASGLTTNNAKFLPEPRAGGSRGTCSATGGPALRGSVGLYRTRCWIISTTASTRRRRSTRRSR